MTSVRISVAREAVRIWMLWLSTRSHNSSSLRLLPRASANRQTLVEMSELHLEQDGIAIVVADGFLPVIHFQSEADDVETALFSTEGDLRLEGLEFRLAAVDDEVSC